MITVEKETLGKQRPRSRYTLSFCTNVRKNLTRKMTIQSQQLNKAQKGNNTVVVNRIFLIFPRLMFMSRKKKEYGTVFFQYSDFTFFIKKKMYIEISRPNVDIWNFLNARKQSMCGFASK